MKTIRLYFLVIVLCSFNTLFAQEELGNGMLFAQFENGTVSYNNGKKYTALLNYDMVHEKMVFMNTDSTVLAIGNPLEILVVIIDNRRFLPVSPDGVFYEEISAGKNSFFVKRRDRIVSEGKGEAYGGYSQASSATTYGSWQDSGGRSTVALKLNEKFKLDNESLYYLKFGNSYKRFFSAKSFAKLFKGHESEIDKFADEQSIDFKKAEDIARIVEYGYSLTSNP